MGDVAEVTAYTATRCHERIEVEDTAVAILRFQNGALGVIEGATSCYPGLLKRTEIHGEHGSARVEQDDITLWQFRDLKPGEEALVAKGNVVSGGAADPRDISHAGHREQISDFLHALDTGGEPRVDGREGRRAVELIRAIYRSARSGKPVSLPLHDDTPLGPP
jgi:predicted dehydrogenase